MSGTNGLVQRPSYYTETTSGFTTSETLVTTDELIADTETTSGFTTSETLVTTDELIAEYRTEVAINGLTVLESGNFVGSGIVTLDFEGAAVTVSGTTATISGIGGGGSGASTLNELTDVTITSVTDNEILSYDSGSGDWINQTAAELNLSETGHSHTESDISDLDRRRIR